MTQTISKNQFKHLTSLKEKKYRKKFREFLIEGPKLCAEALNSDFQLRAIFICPAVLNLSSDAPLYGLLQSRQIQQYEITPGMLDKLSDTVTSQGMIGLVAHPEFSIEKLAPGAKSLIVAVEALADPGNMGTIIRTADWFGADAVILDEASADWLNPKVIRASMGSIFHLPVIEKQKLPETIEYFQQNGYVVIGTSLDGKDLTPPETVGNRQVIILGNEARGLSPEIKNKVTRLVKIQGYGQAESLNVAIAGGILMHFFRSQASGYTQAGNPGGQ